MTIRYKAVNSQKLMSLPYDLKEWISRNDIVHFGIAETIRRFVRFSAGPPSGQGRI